MSNSKLTLHQRLYDVEVGIDSLSVKEDELYNTIKALEEERNKLKLVIEEKRKLKAIIKAEIEDKEKNKPLSIDDENLEKYNNLVKEYKEASKKEDKFFYEKKSLHGGIDSLSPEDLITYNGLKNKKNELYDKYKKMEENELNKPKEITINQKKYKVCKTYSSYGQDRGIIVGETAKMYQIQYAGTKYIESDQYQTSTYIYEYPKSLEKSVNKKKNGVTIVKMYESDEYYTYSS